MKICFFCDNCIVINYYLFLHYTLFFNFIYKDVFFLSAIEENYYQELFPLILSLRPLIPNKKIFYLLNDLVFSVERGRERESFQYVLLLDYKISFQIGQGFLNCLLLEGKIWRILVNKSYLRLKPQPLI